MKVGTVETNGPAIPAESMMQAFLWTQIVPAEQWAREIKHEEGGSPYRLKIRSPSFINLQIMTEAARDQKIADLIAILGTTDIVMGEVDG